MNKEVLKDGVILRRLISDFRKDQNENTLYRVLMCLKDSSVYVACMKSKGNDVITTIDSIDYSLASVQHANKEYVPLFTNLNQANASKHEWYIMEVEFIELFKYIQKKSYDGLLIDGFTGSIKIPSSLFGIMAQL